MRIYFWLNFFWNENIIVTFIAHSKVSIYFTYTLYFRIYFIEFSGKEYLGYFQCIYYSQKTQFSQTFSKTAKRKKNLFKPFVKKKKYIGNYKLSNLEKV